MPFDCPDVRKAAGFTYNNNAKEEEEEKWRQIKSEQKSKSQMKMKNCSKLTCASCLPAWAACHMHACATAITRAHESITSQFQATTAVAYTTPQLLQVQRQGSVYCLLGCLQQRQ
ncbi:unnamed protein product [Ceratitis capitata]|uniref:(Mediterranean fruit fly) hypothetical protein n=1 Tax=Ceratitis capitata TaxID=7213 RepID=A0A811UYP3_CERCA|nr:unnamed protein product [Ceratitis capitata]